MRYITNPFKRDKQSKVTTKVDINGVWQLLRFIYSPRLCLGSVFGCFILFFYSFIIYVKKSFCRNSDNRLPLYTENEWLTPVKKKDACLDSRLSGKCFPYCLEEGFPIVYRRDSLLIRREVPSCLELLMTLGPSPRSPLFSVSQFGGTSEFPDVEASSKRSFQSRQEETQKKLRSPKVTLLRK